MSEAKHVQVTAGVDLSTDQAKTAICVVEWRRGAAIITTLKLGNNDDDIVNLAAACTKVGIDAPFGWPQEFARAVHAYATQPVWPGLSPTRLSRRETDRRVQALAKVAPLAVAADRIGATAMRCAGILANLGVADKSGVGGFCEVYPAAALKIWGFSSKGYKLKKGDQASARVLERNVSRLLSELPTLAVRKDQRALLCASDDAFDSLVAAVVARAVVSGLAVSPASEAEWQSAKVEGWIWLPSDDALKRLTVREVKSAVPS